MANKRRRNRKTAKKRAPLWRCMALVFIALILSPLCILLLYRFQFVHPVSTLMFHDLASLNGYQRQWTPLEKISPSLVNAVLMAEDGRFCEHKGVDWQALQQVVSTENGPQRGASTITMQMIKNLFLWHDRSYLRKGVEIPLAFVADTILPKKRIMEIYLNIAEWAPGIYGAEAAAQYYFHRSAQNLSPWQGALLAVTLPNPELRDPTQPTAKLRQLAGVIKIRADHSGAYTACLQ